MQKRNSGVLLHVSSLPGNYGIGDLGPSAYRFVDMLAENGFKIWQILPLNPIGAGNSPYQSFSAYSGDPIYISPDMLFDWKLISSEDICKCPEFGDGRVDFERVRSWKGILLEKAFSNFKNALDDQFKGEYHAFCNEHNWWLSDYSIFMSMVHKTGTGDWTKWDDGVKNRTPEAMKIIIEDLHDDIDFECFKQFMFFRQYFRLKNYCNQKGIEIFGDMPLYVSFESSDVWANRKIFMLGEDGKPMKVGGVPPDYFCEDGQLWGNPVYDWDELAAGDYNWWVARIYFNLHLFNIVRIDHFRGLDAFWAVPAESKTAKKGEWIPAHGMKLLSILKSRMNVLPIVAEDLGLITESVEQLRDDLELPGMKVLQFAFLSDSHNEHLPHNYTPNCIVYTGTHDNDTTVGWCKALEDDEKELVERYAGKISSNTADRLIEMVWASVAKTAIVPMQDVLSLGSDARMNVPGVPTGNWGWRFSWKQITKQRLQWFSLLNDYYARI